MSAVLSPPTIDLMHRFTAAARAPRLRTLREFAEQEITIPTGPFAGSRYSCARQPFSRLWFDAVESARWRRINTTGPTQSGKTLLGFAIPALYHLFEVRETIIIGLPSLDIAGDKWSEDLLPVIQASRYREFLPRSGAGSRGGTSNMSAVRFTNGATLRFMTGGGDDKSRAAFTARVLLVSETDGMDERSEGSREADKIAQTEARTQAYGDRARVYLECTVSTEGGRTWREYMAGTESRIAIRCPHCRRYVTPEREHLSGWQDAENEMEAGEKSCLACAECGATWTEEQRIAANHDCLLVHRGQEITPAGIVTGTAPRTETLGFRWNAANNLLVKMSDVGRKQWRASRASDEDNAERELLQFWWARPHKSAKQDLTSLDAYVIIKRATDDPRGRVPSDAGRITLGIDLGKYLAHWTLLAWRGGASPHVVEYGRLEIPTNELGEERAILAALREFRDRVIQQGWPADDSTRHPAATFIDCGWNQDIVLTFCQESPGFYACKGFGERMLRDNREAGERTAAGWTVVGNSGAGYEFLRHPTWQAPLIAASADKWKSWLHARIQTPLGQPGALTLHQGNEHLGFAKHLTAEKKVEEFIAGKGVVVRWEKVHKNNHWLDSTCLASIAAHAVGERLLSEMQAPAETPRQQPRNDTINASQFMSRGRGKW